MSLSSLLKQIVTTLKQYYHSRTCYYDLKFVAPTRSPIALTFDANVFVLRLDKQPPEKFLAKKETVKDLRYKKSPKRLELLLRLKYVAMRKLNFLAISI